MKAQRLLAAGLLSLVTVGCGGGGGSKPLTEDDFCTQLATAECQVADRCVNSEDECKTQRKADCTAFAASAKASGSRAFTPANVKACVDQTTSLYSQTDPITPSQLTSVEDTCNYVFQGSVAKSATCTVDYDCADKSNICDKGRCAAKVVKGASGDLCGNAGEVCGVGIYCALVSGAYQCVNKGMSGATCDASTPCLESLRCLNGSCADRVAAQAACGSNDDCPAAAPYCDPAAGNRCDLGLSFSANSPSCCAFGGGINCGAGGTGGGGGTGGAGGGSAGTSGSGGAAGAGGGAGGAAGASGGAGGGSGGSGGAAGANPDAAQDAAQDA